MSLRTMRHMEPSPAFGASLTESPHPAMAPLAFVLERDVDLLLVEELSCSDAFREFFANTVLPGVDLVGANWVIRHSVNRPGLLPGETDIEVTIEGDALPGQIRLLIENKVDAGFQPEQVARYLHEARRVLEAGDCWLAKTCLVAPSGYLESRNDAAAFDVSLAYETIAEHLSGRARDRRWRTRCTPRVPGKDRRARGFEGSARLRPGPAQRDYRLLVPLLAGRNGGGPIAPDATTFNAGRTKLVDPLPEGALPPSAAATCLLGPQAGEGARSGRVPGLGGTDRAP